MQLSEMSLRKRILVGVLGICALGAVTFGVYYAWLITPLPVAPSPEEALETIGSARFARMPDYRKEEYIDQTRRLMDQMPPEQRRELFQRARTDESIRESLGQVRRQEMTQRAIDFARISSAEERARVLDEAIDRMEQRRSQRSQARSDGQRRGGGGGRGRGAARERIQQRFEQGNPQINALIGEYFRALRERREERGLTRR